MRDEGARRPEEAPSGDSRGNSFVGAREREQAAYRFEELVEEIVYSHEAGFSKPDSRIYALICARLDVPPGEMTFFDDTDACVTGASP